MTNDKRTTDNGWRKYTGLYPLLIGLIMIITSFVTLQNRVDGQADDILGHQASDKETAKEHEDRIGQQELSIQQLKIQTAVIKQALKDSSREQQEIKGDIKEILRTIRGQ